MGASFQAPCATPGQRLMEMHHVSLIILCISVCFYDKSHMYVQNECDKIIIINNDGDNEMAVTIIK